MWNGGAGKLAKHSINKLCCHEIYKSTNGKTGHEQRKVHSSPLGNPLSLVLLLVLLLLRSVGLWGSLVWLVMRQTNELRRRQRWQLRNKGHGPMPAAIQAGRTDGCGFVGCAVCDRCPLPQLPLVIFKTATADDGHGNEMR